MISSIVPGSVRYDTASAAAAASTAAVGSSASSTTSGATNTPAGGTMGKDAFMKLLIAQLQNQDPTNPMDGTQMASQLATFSSLEQLQDINATLTSGQSSQSNLLGAIQASSAIATIGHTAVASGNQVQVGGAAGASNVTVDLGSAAASGTLHLYNSSGTEVGTRSLGSLAAGRQTIDLGSATNGLPDGTYTYSVDAKDASGAAVAVQTYTVGKIDGVSTSANGIVLTAGGLSIPYATIQQIIN